MNFIDRALAQGDALTDDDLLQAMADIYQEPQVWGELDRYPRYIRDVICIIDYDTALADSDPDCEDETVSAGFEALSRRTALRQDYEGFWDLVRAYIGRERG